MIVSFRDGRVRLRSPALRSPETVEEITGILSAYAGVEKTESNVRTGSLLVLYDPAAISREHLEMAVTLLEDRLQSSHSPSKRCGLLGKSLTPRKIEKGLLLGSMVVTVIGALSNAKTLHISGGTLFLLLAARHVHARRNAL